uniref:Gamma-glutamylaminecyclotransferase n=1 Tax=Crocodylus porosus TaxID=8502 RepID=A0A7M4FJ67_CROPO
MVTIGRVPFVGRMAHVFVYGTLKKGQPNYQRMINSTHGIAKFQGRGRTVEKYPLVIAGKYNIPYLLNMPGTGHHVAGEIYTVDDQMLQFLDEFEGCPDMYQRTPVRIAVVEWKDSVHFHDSFASLGKQDDEIQLKRALCENDSALNIGFCIGIYFTAQDSKCVLHLC